MEISLCFGRCEHTVRQFLCKKTCLYADFDTRDNDCVHSFEHNFAVVYPTWCVSTKLYQLQHVTTCKFSLKRHVSALFWLTRTCPCPTFNICGHDWAETFHCCDHRIGPWDAFTAKNVPLRNFLTYKTMYMCNKYHITPCFFSTSFPSIHLNSHTTTWLFNSQILWRNRLTGGAPSPSPPSLLGYG